MNQRSLACLLSLGLVLTGLSACRSETPRPAITPRAEVVLGPDRYVLMTYRKTIIPSGPEGKEYPGELYLLLHPDASRGGDQ